MCGSKNKHYEGKCLQEIRLHAKNTLIAISSNSQHDWRGYAR